MHSFSATIKAALAAILVLPCAAALAGPGPLFSGDFTGGVFFPHVGNGFDGIDSNGADSVVFGDISFDSSLVPPAVPGLVNVPIPNANPIFDISIGSAPLKFNYAQGDALAIDAQFNNINGFVQYNNGSFAGVVFNGDFLFNGAPYRLDMQGSLWTIFHLSAAGPTGFEEGAVASGFLNGGLTNIQSIQPIPITGAVPEPSTYAMLLAGLVMLTMVARRRVATRPIRA
jgi:hypothetical protein